MLGLINDCTEQLVISKFGVEAWHAIKSKAGLTIKDGGFVKHSSYPDSITLDIVVAAAEALSVSVDDVLELFGQYFLEYTRANGYDNLLRCQGSTLRLWLSSLNALHDHLQSSLPAGSFPVFWCEDCEEQRGSILFHYYSVRGALLAQLVVGLVKEVSIYYFEVEIKMERLRSQGEEGAECTTWRISAVDPGRQWKLTGNAAGGGACQVVRSTMERRSSWKRRNKRRSTDGGGTNSASQSEDGGESSILSGAQSSEMRCPFTGNMVSSAGGGGADSGAPSEVRRSTLTRIASDLSLRSLLSMNTSETGPTIGTTISTVLGEEEKKEQNGQPRRAPSPVAEEGEGNVPPSCRTRHGSNGPSLQKDGSHVSKLISAYDFGLSASKVQNIFPYHVMIDKNFEILQVGRRLPGLLRREEVDLVGKPIVSVLQITKPVLATWDWPMMQKLSDQIFFLTPVQQAKFSRRGSLVSFRSATSVDDATCKGRIRAPREAPDIRFKGSVVQVSRHKAILVLSPDAANISELSAMGLTMSDLPLHSFQRDSVFLGEHIASEVRSAHKLDKLSKRLEIEKNLSNSLLYNMLPESVADDLRAGKTVEPTHFENVTLFFSDVVGFTSICDSIEPWDVIDMLNQLYSVMDFLSSHFNLYKVETVGDAYMCCSGLPVPAERHAENIANYALAVRECVKHVKSPADGRPLQLRIGIHTGHCMGGVVGTLTPHYCLFGDMVNTTARHESTGMPDKIQCSAVLNGQLKHLSIGGKELYKFTPRGVISMKGKGNCYTYWLDSGTSDNVEASPTAIKELYKEVGELLLEEKWKKRKYFRRCTPRDSKLGDSVSMASSAWQFDLGDVTPSQSSATSANSFYGANYKGSPSVSDDGNFFEVDDHNRQEQERRLSQLDDMLSDADFDGPPPPLTCPHVDDMLDEDEPNQTCIKDTWAKVGWCPDLSENELISHVHELLLDHFHKCLTDLPDNLELLDSQLYGYVRTIAESYHGENRYHNWHHACHVVLGASHLVDFSGISNLDPWLGFVAIFAALVHDVKHLGVPNVQLETEGHVLIQLFDNGSCQERQSCHISIKVFIEDYPDLSTVVLRGCPTFLHLVTSAVLSTDVASREAQEKMRDRFDGVVAAENSPLLSGVEQERSLSILEHVLLLCDIGHCSQDFNTFLRWNGIFYEECFVNFKAGRGDDPRPNWYVGQISFLEGYVIPLAARCEELLNGLQEGEPCRLVEGTKKVVQLWKESGQAWTEKTIAAFGDKHQGLEDARPFKGLGAETMAEAGIHDTSGGRGESTGTLIGSAESGHDTDNAFSYEDDPAHADLEAGSGMGGIRSEFEAKSKGAPRDGQRWITCWGLCATRERRVIWFLAVIVAALVVVAITAGAVVLSRSNATSNSTSNAEPNDSDSEAVNENRSFNDPGGFGLDPFSDAASAAGTTYASPTSNVSDQDYPGDGLKPTMGSNVFEIPSKSGKEMGGNRI